MTTKPKPNYTLSGQITNMKGEPLEGLIVRAYDQHPKSPGNVIGLAIMA